MLLENDADTHTSVAQIIHSTPHYNRQEREKIVKANLKVITHPYYSSYTPLQKLCLRILRHEKNKYGAKDDKIHGVLFDVSYLWEEYLATILSKQGFKHPNNKRGTGRIYLALPNQFPRYPDFYREGAFRGSRAVCKKLFAGAAVSRVWGLRRAVYGCTRALSRKGGCKK